MKLGGCCIQPLTPLRSRAETTFNSVDRLPFDLTLAINADRCSELKGIGHHISAYVKELCYSYESRAFYGMPFLGYPKPIPQWNVR